VIELVMGAAAVGLLIAAAWLGVRADRLGERGRQLEKYSGGLTDWEGRLGVYAVQLANMHGLLEKRVADDPRYEIFWKDVEDGKQGAEEKKPG